VNTLLILVDAMGGDHAPLEIIRGCELAAKEYNIDIILCGNEKIVKQIISDNGIDSSKFTYVNTESVIEMQDHADCIMKEKNDSSMAVGLKLLKNNGGDAFITAGNSGAALVGATLINKRIPGIKRAALAPVLPSGSGRAMLIDCGANVECKAEYLNQFAMMGSVYIEAMFGVKNPKVGLLNNGAEETKGTELLIEANKLMSENPEINFIGNIEGRDGPLGKADVIVSDGFTGNIYLKTMEGMGKFLLNGLKDIFYKNFATKIAAAILKNRTRKRARPPD
jgi:glycerol-3-phosphate acyltransferase PlsX